MTRPTPTGLNRRKASGRAWPAASTRASHSGCNWSRYGSSETTLTVASATPSPVSWISSWYRGGSAASRAASGCGSRASRAATVFTSRSYGAAPGRGILRKAEPAAATPGGGAAACRPLTATPVRAGNSPRRPMCQGDPPDHHDDMDFTTPARLGLRAPAAAAAPALTPAPRAGIALIAVAAVAAEMAVSARYGYVRDELYFLSAGQHLAFGYVDQPPLTPLLARLGAALTANTLAGFRVLPALALGALVVMTATMSARLGAGRTGQMLAALAAATCAEYLGAMHELTTTTPDFVFWTATLLLVMKLLASRDPRWWVAIGGCAGLASEAKWNIAFLLAALAAGFLLTDARRLLRSRYLLIGGLITATLAAPDLIWQAAHGWPGLEVFRALQTEAGHNRLVYWPGQVLYTGLVLTPLWIAGAAWSLRSAAARPFRPAAIACVAVIVLQFVLGGKPYYAGAAFTFLLAAGCVPLERRLARRRASSSRAPASSSRAPASSSPAPAFWAGAAMVASAALAMPGTLPVLPARVLHTIPLQKINYDLGRSEERRVGKECRSTWSP